MARLPSQPFSALRARPRSGFTLVEILIALSLLGLLTLMLFTSFNAVVRSWETGRAAIDATGHADYLMEQLASALRSAFYPGSGEKYGFILSDDGEGERARDVIEWTKVGPALVGEDAEFAKVPHRCRVAVADPDGDFPGGFTVRAWRQDLQLEEFDPENDTVELCLSPKVIGFNCRVLDPDQAKTADGEINWVDEWAKTNMLPTALEITLWMEPPEKDEEPIESKRIVEIPLGSLSQNPSLASSANQEARGNTSASAVHGRRRGSVRREDTSGGIFEPGSGRGNSSNSNNSSSTRRPSGSGSSQGEADSSPFEPPPPPPGM